MSGQSLYAGALVKIRQMKLKTQNAAKTAIRPVYATQMMVG